MKRFFVLLFSLFLSLSILAKENTPSTTSNNKYFDMAKNIELFTNVYKELNNSYVDDIDPNTLMTNGINKMLENLDPFTNYITGADIDEYQMQTTGKYGGIGARIGRINNEVMITEPYEGFPAQKNGLEPGDVIIEIDGKVCKDYNSSDVSELLKGEPGTSLTVKVRKAISNEIKTYTFNREEIKINSVAYSGMLDNNIGYIKLISFTENASKEVQDALLNLKKNPNLKGVVFDLRGNGGGLLMEAVNICNAFIDKGNIVVSTKGKVPENNYDYTTQNSPVDLQIPLAILIDENSASASEIVSGSIQDLDRGVVIGQNSYGKGLVQVTKPVGYKSKLKLTISKYYIPSGRCIQRIDYSHRDENGKASALPDSLRSVFKTKNGRLVKDGAGIEPDIKTEEQVMSPITIALYVNNLIFDYATQYKYDHKVLRDSTKFSMNEEEYKQFVKFLEGKKYDYTSKTEETLDKLNDLIKDENYSAEIKSTLGLLHDKIDADKKQDVFKYEQQIKKLLEDEIVARYYFEKGRIANSLINDNDVAKAKEILLNYIQYKEILSAKK
ncbi:MAG TPA: S41 family peptidase [Chitinophagales bacterium]|nr:S41 family peptidase [Chitinophagales bacterium]MCB9075602.1 S41 family peptidase [Chitinophagales bacterium]HMU97637.1 S41 family peptidase [Chitinophagales bacterium]HMV01953.1 S41 family peptidase [Chitinophagales bacterium]HMW93891.1 S41 family peptidase [Chitinophagales bacterium]